MKLMDFFYKVELKPWFQLKHLQHLIDQEVFDDSALIKAKELLKSLQSKTQETAQNNAKKKERKQAKTDVGKSQRTLFDVIRPSCSKSDWKDRGSSSLSYAIDVPMFSWLCSLYSHLTTKTCFHGSLLVSCVT